MDPKPRPNDDRYFELLRRMTPGDRLAKAMEICQVGRELFFATLRRNHPALSESEIRQLAVKWLYQR
jgi:hypothetical protein